MRKKLIFSSLVAALVLQGCGKGIRYRVDGPTPQEQYSVEMSPDIDTNIWGKVPVPVSEVVTPASSRPRIVEKLLIGAIGSDGIAYGDTYYKFVPANERMGYRATFDTPVVPDFNILIRDLLRHGGVQETTSQADAYQLVVADSALFASRTDTAFTYECNTCNSEHIGDDGRWYFFMHAPATDRGTPQMMYCLMSVLRYWYDIPVFPCADMSLTLTVLVDDSFYSQPVDFEAVNAMLRTTYGLQMVPSGRKMEVKTYSVQQ